MMRSEVTHEWKEYLRSIGIHPPNSNHFNDIESNWADSSLRGNEMHSQHFEVYRMVLNGKANEIQCKTQQLQDFVDRIQDFAPLSEQQISAYAQNTLPDTALRLMEKEANKKSRIYRGLEDIVYLDHTLSAHEDILTAKVQALIDTLDDRKKLIAEMAEIEEQAALIEKHINQCANNEEHEMLEECREKRESLKKQAREFVMESLLSQNESSSMQMARALEKKLSDALDQLNPETRIHQTPEKREQMRNMIAASLKSKNSPYPQDSPFVVQVVQNFSTTHEKNIYHRGRDTITAQQGSNVNTGDGDQYTERNNTE